MLCLYLAYICIAVYALCKLIGFAYLFMALDMCSLDHACKTSQSPLNQAMARPKENICG